MLFFSKMSFQNATFRIFGIGNKGKTFFTKKQPKRKKLSAVHLLYFLHFPKSPPVGDLGGFYFVLYFTLAFPFAMFDNFDFNN